MTNQTQLFEAALGIKAPWYVQGIDFGAELTIAVDFVAGTRFGYTPGCRANTRCTTRSSNGCAT
jgi:hypothetical protein